ncbi:MAG TPA: transposase [Gemmataceae bacterium]|jgi:transposase-like protein|nr:transposase [Gemmataceae bacterium]
MSKSRDRDKERFWRRMVRQWRGSSLSVRAFCDQHGLSEPTFYAWRRNLAERDAEAVQFVPVEVVADPPAPARAEGSPAGLELVLGEGRRLRIGPGFDAATLERLLALLEESRP